MVPAQQSQPPAPTDAPKEVFCLSQERLPGHCEHSGRRREFVSTSTRPQLPQAQKNSGFSAEVSA